MNKVAKFEKVSFEQFEKDYIKTLQVSEDKVDEQYIRYIYDNIKLPKRATTGSAGYDFFSPITFNLRKGESFTIPTGIKAKMEDGWMLTMHIRSSLGFKYGISLSNTTGIVDQDYYNSVKNEGHIFIKLPEVEILWGQAIDEALEDKIRVTVIATGFSSSGTAMSDAVASQAEELKKMRDDNYYGEGDFEKVIPKPKDAQKAADEQAKPADDLFSGLFSTGSVYEDSKNPGKDLASKPAPAASASPELPRRPASDDEGSSIPYLNKVDPLTGLPRKMSFGNGRKS